MYNYNTLFSTVDNVWINRGYHAVKNVVVSPQFIKKVCIANINSGLNAFYTHSIWQFFNDIIHTRITLYNTLSRLLIPRIHSPYYYNHQEEIKER